MLESKSRKKKFWISVWKILERFNMTKKWILWKLVVNFFFIWWKKKFSFFLLFLLEKGFSFLDRKWVKDKFIFSTNRPNEKEKQNIIEREKKKSILAKPFRDVYEKIQFFCKNVFFVYSFFDGMFWRFLLKKRTSLHRRRIWLQSCEKNKMASLLHFY